MPNNGAEQSLRSAVPTNYGLNEKEEMRLGNLNKIGTLNQKYRYSTFLRSGTDSSDHRKRKVEKNKK